MMLSDMLGVAKECLKHPGRRAVWSPELQQYVCPELLGDQVPALDSNSHAHPSISPQFKLVFVTAAGGTLLFVLICVGLTLATRGALPDLQAKLVTGLFDLAKIGFGAVVGLLGGQQLQGKREGA